MKDSSFRKVSVVHIGDSHLQADFFSGKLRELIQQKFGNAGRGLVFPFRVAKTNSPADITSSSKSFWEARRNVFADKPLPIGVCGITLRTPDSSAEMKVALSGKDSIGNRFSRLTLFHEKGPEAFDFIVYDEKQTIEGFINSRLQTDIPFASCVQFDEPLTEFTLRCYKRDSSQVCAQVYGMMLENSSRGVLYNMIGVNGAEYRHYNRSEKFTEQLGALAPDLLIISLGTNDAFTKGFDKSSFYNNIDTLVTAIRKKQPGAGILLTTPADSYRRKKYKNPDMLTARNTIIDYCRQHGVAYWDLYGIMGGFGSIGKWYLQGLAQNDRLHFTRAGYELQGRLLYNALLKSFSNYYPDGTK